MFIFIIFKFLSNVYLSLIYFFLVKKIFHEYLIFFLQFLNYTFINKLLKDKTKINNVLSTILFYYKNNRTGLYKLLPSHIGYYAGKIKLIYFTLNICLNYVEM